MDTVGQIVVKLSWNKDCAHRQSCRRWPWCEVGLRFLISGPYSSAVQLTLYFTTTVLLSCQDEGPSHCWEGCPILSNRVHWKMGHNNSTDSIKRSCGYFSQILSSHSSCIFSNISMASAERAYIFLSTITETTFSLSSRVCVFSFNVQGSQIINWNWSHYQKKSFRRFIDLLLNNITKWCGSGVVIIWTRIHYLQLCMCVLFHCTGKPDNQLKLK